MTRALSALGAAGAVALLPLALATPVDVDVDGERALDDFANGTTTDPLVLAAGCCSVAVFPGRAARRGAARCSSAPPRC